MKTARKEIALYAIFCLILLSSCDNHPFNPLANDLADKWEEIWSLTQKYESGNNTALIKEKMGIENGDRKKLMRLGDELDKLIKEGSELMKGKEVKVELPKGYKGYLVPEPWTIEGVSTYSPTRITIKGCLEFTEYMSDNPDDKKMLWLVAFAGNVPVCLFKTIDSHFERLSDDSRVVPGTRYIFIEQSPDIYAYQWDKIASITHLAWVYEDSEELQKAREGLSRDIELEERFRRIIVE